MSELENLASRVPHDRGPELLAIFNAGEVTLGLTLLIENLYEFDVAVSERERRYLREAALNAGVEYQVMAWLDDL